MISNCAVIYRSNNEKVGKMLVELSTFKVCTSNELGGSIYQIGGNCVLNKCCSNSCFTRGRTHDNGRGQFLYTELSSSSKNNVLDSSICLCYNSDQTIYQAPVWLQEGNILVKTVNISKNKCIYDASFVCYHTSTNGYSLLSFISIRANNSTYRTCYFGEKAKGHDLKYANIIENMCASSDFGMIYSNKQLEIFHCCIIGNNAPFFFQSASGSSNTKISIIDSTVNSSDLTKTIGSIITNDLKPNYSFINVIRFTKDAEYCQASYDAIGDLFPIIPFKSFHVINLV